MRKYLAECIGTFTLVLFGCGAAVIAGASVGVLGIAFAFGFGISANPLAINFSPTVADTSILSPDL